MLGFVAVMSGPRCGSDYLVPPTFAGMPKVRMRIGNIERGTSSTGGPTVVLRRWLSPSWHKVRSTFRAVCSCPRSARSPRHFSTRVTWWSWRRSLWSSSSPSGRRSVHLDARGTDRVDASFSITRCSITPGHMIVDLLGDRPHSGKKLDRWLSKLWRLGIGPVMDIRLDNH